MSKTVIISGGMLDEGFAEKVLEANPEAYIIAVDIIRLRMRRIQRLLFGWELHWEAKR